MNLRRRLCNLEAAMLESQVAQIQAYIRSLTEAELDLFIGMGSAVQTGEQRREYTLAEFEAFDRHVKIMCQFSDAAHDESNRRLCAGLLADGKITRSEVIELFGEKFL
jgi:hypothetical protein